MRPSQPRSLPGLVVKRRHTRKRLLWSFLVLLLLFFPLALLHDWVPSPLVTGLARLVVGRQPDAVPWNHRQPVNLLLMGVHAGNDRVKPLTDSLMVVSFNPGERSISLLSIPRDLWIDIPGHGQGRINQAFQDGGATETMLAVQQNLGIPVNYYAVVDYTAVEALIDHLGGVTIDVPYDIDDPTFPGSDGTTYEPYAITKGVHHMSGREALRYARTRRADSDFGRAARQQQLLLALKDQVVKPRNWLYSPFLLREARATIRTNFPMDQVPGIIAKIIRVDRNQIHQEVLSFANGAVYGYVTPSGADVLLPNRPIIEDIVDHMFRPSLEILETPARVRVDNGNGYAGAASHFTQVLQRSGVHMLSPGTADRTDYPTHQVQVFSKEKDVLQKASLIASMLGTAAQKGRGESDADIVIILGRNWAPFIKFTPEGCQEALKPQ